MHQTSRGNWEAPAAWLSPLTSPLPGARVSPCLCALGLLCLDACLSCLTVHMACPLLLTSPLAVNMVFSVLIPTGGKTDLMDSLGLMSLFALNNHSSMQLCVIPVAGSIWRQQSPSLIDSLWLSVHVKAGPQQNSATHEKYTSKRHTTYSFTFREVAADEDRKDRAPPAASVQFPICWHL